MANKLYEESSIQDIADAIRSKNGSSDTYTVSEMSTAIENIPSGGGSASDYFFTDTAQSGTGIVKYIKKVPSLVVSNLSYFASDMTTLEEVETITATNIGSCDYAFYNCRVLEKIQGLNITGVTSALRMFDQCYALKTAPSFDTSQCTSFYRMLRMTSALENLPIYNMSSATNLQQMFDNFSRHLTDTSLDNLLQSLISATSYTGTKTLAYLGFSGSLAPMFYPASRIEALPHYQDFIDAGWSIGY